MLTVTATTLRNNIFKYLSKVEQGETVTVILNKKEAARLVPVHRVDWRDGLQQEININCSSEELMAPIEDMWDDYI